MEDRAGRHNRKEAEVWAQKRKKTANFIEEADIAETGSIYITDVIAITMVIL